jgi:hypothetical protein
MEPYMPNENDHVLRGYRMISGQGEAQSKKYFKHIGKSGKIWLIADQPNSADNIYVEGGPNSRGFGGSTLTFPLVEGGEINLKGPWHSNDSALFNDTGIDISDKHHVMIIIGEDVKYGKNNETIVHKVLFKDDEPVLGVFHRGDVLGREWAQKLGKRVFVVDETTGGGCRRFIEPTAIFYWETEHKSIDDVSPAQAGIIFS